MESFYSKDQRYGYIPAELAKTMAGLDICRKMITGEIDPPPIYGLLNIRLTDCDNGSAKMEGRPSRDYYNPIATVHGGWIAAILDSVLASTVLTMLPIGVFSSTAEFKVQIVRPLKEEAGDVICEGKIIHCGRTIATSEARLFTAEGKLIAHAVETCVLSRPV